MPESFFIPPDDGQTLAAELPGVPGLYPAAEIRYRPCPPLTRLKYHEATGAEARERVGSEIISRNIVELRPRGGGEAVRLTPDQCRQMHADLWNVLLNHCLGFIGPRVEDAEKN